MASRVGARSSSRNGSRTTLPLSEDGRLSVIVEDGEAASVPRIPQRTHNRPFSRRWNLGDPPAHSFEKSPPPYSVWNITGPKGEKLTDMRNNKYIARRGGWIRLLVVATVVILVLVALIVGLVLGLRRKSHSSYVEQPSSPSTPGPSSSPNSFPAGSYTMTTFLDTISTNCTSNPATWRCYPYTTYNSAPSAAMATFNWIITATSSPPPSQGNYTISSTDNPFAINFVNVSLILVDADAPTERYTFTVPIDKVVLPSAAITTDNSLAACYFNATNFEASLYTKVPQSYSEGSSSAKVAATPSSFEPWPYAVKVAQSIGGGSSVPECFKVFNGDLGDRITNGLTAEASGNVCSCEYRN